MIILDLSTDRIAEKEPLMSGGVVEALRGWLIAAKARTFKSSYYKCQDVDNINI